MGIQYRYQNWHREGTRSALHGLALRAIKPLVPYRALYGMQVRADQVTLRDYPAVDFPYEIRFLDEHEVLRFLEHEPTLRPTPTREALARGDRCYAVLDGDRLASYGWYATRPLIVAAGLDLDFDPAYAYMHTGYTHADYRGKRLHAIGMTRVVAASSRVWIPTTYARCAPVTAWVTAVSGSSAYWGRVNGHGAMFRRVAPRMASHCRHRPTARRGCEISRRPRPPESCDAQAAGRFLFFTSFRPAPDIFSPDSPRYAHWIDFFDGPRDGVNGH